MKEITVDSYSIPAKSRSKNYYGSSTVVKSGGSGSSWTSGTTVPTAAVIPDTDWAKILRKDQADTTNYTVDFKAGILLNSKAVTSLLDSTTTDVGTDKALYSSARVDLLISNLAKTYIRKDKDDTTDHSLTINANLTVKGTSTLTTAVITTLMAEDAIIMGALNTATITASGMITANAGVTATTLTTTGLATLARLSTPIADITELTAKNETVTGHLTTADITASGLITANAGVLATTLTTTGLATLATADIKGQATIEAAMCSPDWASRTKGWGVTRAGAADFRNIYADELRVLAFTADISQALAGSDYLTKSVSKLSANFVVPAAGSAVRIIVDDLEGFPATQCFANGDYIRFRAFDRSAGLVIADVWGTVSLDTTYGNSGYTGGTQAYTFSCTKTSGAGLTIYKGSEVLDYGKSGDGLIKRTVLDAIGSPYEEIDTWTTSPTTANNYTVHVRMGSLIGLANCNGWGLYTDNAYLTSKVVVGDLTKKANYLEYNGTSLTVRGDIYLSSGQAAASTGSVTAAVNTAAADATTKANNAQTDAVNTAAADATTKANNAQTASKTYTDAQITVVNNSIALKVSQTDYNANNTAIGKRISAVEVTTAGISTRVDTVSDTATSALNNAQTAQTAADKANTDLSSYKTTVANTYSTIEQTSSSIDAKINTSVASGGAVYTAVASSFSMSGNGISLFGKTLNITGATIFSSLATTSDVATAKSVAIDTAYIYGNNALDSAKTYVDGKGYTTSSDVDSQISGKGYTTTADVNTLISGKGFATSTSVKSNLDSIGTQLGYTDYADFVAASELNTTLINGGYINTTLIDTDALVARTAFIASLKSLLITADNINAVAINANSITAGKLSVDRIDTTSITALGAVTAGSFNIGSGKFVVDTGGYLTATGANLTGTVTATNGVIGGLTISSTIPNISTSPLSSTASYTGYLTSQGIGVYHSYGDNSKYVAVTINDNPDTINVVTKSNTGHGIIETSVWGLPSSKAAVVANVHPSDSNYDEAGIGFATNGGVVANRFQTLGGAQLLQLLAYGTVTGTSSGATLSDTYCMTGSISVSRSGEGVYTVTGLNMSDTSYFHRVIAYGTTNNMKVTVYDENWNHFTAEVSDDDSTNDSNFRFMVVGYRKY